MRKSFFSRYLWGIAATVLITGIATAQEAPKTTNKRPRLTYSDIVVSREMKAADVAPRDPKSAPVPKADVGEGVGLTPTLEYFRDLQAIVRDLRRNSTGGQTSTPGLKGVWMRKQAAKIDAIPVLGVDPGLLEVGQRISTSLYDAADGVTVGMGRSRVRQAAEPMHYDYYQVNDVYAFGRPYGYGGFGYGGFGYGGYGYGYPGWYGSGFYGPRYGYGLVPYGTSTVVAVPNSYSRTRQQLMIGQEERISAVNTARTALENAEREVASVRRALTSQYGVEF